MPEKYLRSRLTVLFSAFVANAAIDAGVAQTANSTSSEQPLELSPFVVQAEDEGWLAGNTMLSNRTNQSLKDVPVTIDSLTKDFLVEVGVYEAFDAAKWVANADVVREGERALSIGTSGTPQDSNRYSFRGVPNEGGPTRNFFPWGVPSDTYNVERIDFGRGSNSLLFGDMEPGGQGNIYTKRATIGRNFGNALAQVGSYDTYRANLDYNLSPSKRFAARLNLTKSEQGKEYDFGKFGLEAAHAAVTYRLFKNTELRADAEIGAHRRNWGTNDQRIVERPATGRGFANKWTVLADNSVVLNTALPAADRTNSTGALLSLVEDDPGGFPRHYNWSPQKHLDQDYHTVSAFLEQRLGKLGLELSLNQQTAVRDRAETYQGNRISADSAGRLYIDFTYQEATQRATTMTYRGMAVYHWEPVRWMSQLVVGSLEWRENRNSNGTFQQINELDNPGVLSGAGPRIWYRVYVNDPGAYDPAVLSARSVPSTAAFRAVMFPVQLTEQLSRFWNQTVSANGRYFDGRLQSMAGVRRDRGYRLTAVPWGTANRGPRGEAIPIGPYDEHPERYVLDPALSNIDELSHTYGLVYRLTSTVNLYATQSQSFRAANGNATNFIDEPIGQQRGETFEVGIKSDLFNRKLVWNLNWYELARDNVTFQFAQTGITTPELEALFNPNGLSSADPKYLVVNTTRRELRSTFSKGVESTLIFFLGAGWNVRIAGAYKKVTQDAAMPRFKQLLEEARARGNENPAHLAAAQTIVDMEGNRGSKIAGRFATPFTFNFAVNYRFNRSGWLKDLSLGLNGAYNDNYIFAYLSNLPVEGGEEFTLNGTASYRVKIMKRPVTLQLNVRNLIENDYITVGVVQLANATRRNVNAYGLPRSFLLTATTQF